MNDRNNINYCRYTAKGGIRVLYSVVVRHFCAGRGRCRHVVEEHSLLVIPAAEQVPREVLRAISRQLGAALQNLTSSYILEDL